MKTKITLLLMLCFSVTSAAAQIEAVKVPAEVKPFVAEHTKPITLKSGDLNGDGLKDYILVLERENPTVKDENDYPKNQRPLLILVRGAGNKLTEAKRNETIVMCSECGGMMGDPFAGVTVGKNTFTVNHYGGSAWRWTADYKFNYSRIDKTWQLVRIEKTNFHATDQNKTLERKIMTPPKDFGKVDIADFDSSAYDETEKATFQQVDFDGFNHEIEKAAVAGEAWVKMPTLVVARVLREFSEFRSRTIEMSASNSEATDSLTVIVIDDGFSDDSVRGDKHQFELRTNEQGVWKFVSAGKSWRCWEGRGHQDFSLVKCL